jgi:DNA-directed RNA polymerase subunit RPC12/RpoP
VAEPAERLEPDEEPEPYWCEDCERLVEEDELTEDGACPTCGTVLAEEERRPIPWYFKGLIVATVIYLGWRAYQGIGWLVHHA